MGENNYNVSMHGPSEENGRLTFYVRPFSEEIVEDLNRLMEYAPKAKGDTTITEHNGTYAISTSSVHDTKDFMESLWGMLYRRFSSEAKRVCVDPITQKKIYVVIFSRQFIEPCGPRQAA